MKQIKKQNFVKPSFNNVGKNIYIYIYIYKLLSQNILLNSNIFRLKALSQWDIDILLLLKRLGIYYII